MIEVNPRASRTVPFVSKTTGVPLAKVAVRVMLGGKLADYGLTAMKKIPYVSVKEAVLPFNKFPGVDTLLSPEMKSTGEVMGISLHFGESYYKADARRRRFPAPRGDRAPVHQQPRAGTSSWTRCAASTRPGSACIATEGTAQYYSEHGHTLRAGPQGQRGQAQYYRPDEK